MTCLVKTSVVLATILSPLFLFSTNVFASEFLGNMPFSDFATLSGVVVVPPPPPPSEGGNTGGNGGGGGNTGGGGGGGNTAANTSALTAAQKPYDTNGDDRIDVLDFNALMVHWGEKGNVVGDFDKNGVVDVFDFNALMVHWTA